MSVKYAFLHGEEGNYPIVSNSSPCHRARAHHSPEWPVPLHGHLLPLLRPRAPRQ